MRLTLLSAVLFSASLPPIEFGWLAWAALVPFFIATARTSPRRAAAQGAIWGTLVCVLTGYCFPAMLERYLGAPVWLGWPVFLLGASLAIGLPSALFAGWLAWLAARGTTPLVAASLFSLAEFVRLRASFDIPWALVAHSQIESAAMLGLAALAGAGGIGFVVAATNALLASFFERRLAGHRPGVARTVALLVVLVGLGAGTLRDRSVDIPDDSVLVGIIQGGHAYAARGPREPAQLGLERYLGLSEAAVARGAKVLAWPEYAVDLHPYALAPESEQLRRASAVLDADLLLGAAHLVLRDDGDRQHNSVYLTRGGRWTARYDKEKLLRLGEGEWLGIRDRLGLSSYLPGDEARPLSTRLGRVGVALCSEVMDPWLVRRRVLDGAEVLLVPSNDSWFGAEFARRHQLAITRLRAAETGRFVLRPASNGVSALIDPRGRLVAASSGSAAEVLVGRASPRSERTPWVRYGHLLWVALLGIVLIASLRARRRAHD